MSGAAIAGKADRDEALNHILPEYFQKFQDWAFLPILILAECLVNGFMMASGLVADQNNPFAGGWGNWILESRWIALFLAGAVMGGMALRTSAAASYWMSRSIGRGLFNLVGMLGFSLMEIWAGIMERSVNSIMTPADLAVLTWAGFSHPHISVTDVIISFGLPLASMFWGFSSIKGGVKSLAEIQREGEARLARAQNRALIMQANAAGLGGAVRAGTKAALGRITQDDPEQVSNGNPDGFDGPNPGGGMAIYSPGLNEKPTGTDGAVSFGKQGPSSRRLRTIGATGGIPNGWIDKAGLIAKVAEDYGVEISPTEALAFIKAQNTAYQCQKTDGVQGNPWIAQKAPTLQAARRKWAPRPATVAEGE